MAEGLVKGQRIFAAHLAAKTGLDPRVIGAWLKSEQSGSAAEGYEKRGYYDWLNIANTDSGPASGSNSSAWRNPVSAANATAEWIQGRGQIAKEYGKPAAGIRRILSTASKDPQAQIDAIGSSGWATAPDYGSKIGALFNELRGDKSLVHEAQRAGDASLYDNHTASAAASLAAMGLTGPQATLNAQGAAEGPQSADMSELLRSLVQKPPAESSVAATQLARPATSGGPAQAGGPRVPAPLSSPAPAEGERQDAILSLVRKLSQDSEATPTTTPTEAGAAPQAVHPEVANGEALHPDKVTQLKGLVQFDGKPVAAWIGHILQYVEKVTNGKVKPEVESGYRSEAEQERIYNSGVRPAAKPGSSKHELKAFPGGAVDLENAAEVAKVIERSPYAHLLVYAGGKDPVHLSHPVNGTY